MNKEEVEDRWIARHSINCIKCGNLVDERDCIPARDGEGSICPQCMKKKSSPKKSKMSQLDAMMAWEGGNLTMKQYFTLFADLIKSGQAWTLQGMYGRTASRLIADGYISQHGKILWKEIKAQGVDLDAMLYSE